ncbi:S-adenosylmethionine-dependent methyltransferase Rv2258c-like [Amphiura filiformis]|uniref:S-adenosylmethionine-dependent methyltransferase Rv2258c-like n=1 Tax=Amphiura filiformis TaxID=82378 RepID=UPI003B20EE15
MAAKEQETCGETADQFAMKLHGHVMSSYITIGIAFGDRLGLFELMATFDGSKTAGEIATAAKLKGRYVQEWLGLMVIADIIDADDKGTAFFLPLHRRKNLTAEGGVGNIGIPAAGIPTFMKGFEYVINAAKEAGPNGFPQGATADVFWPWMDSFTEALMPSAALFSSIVPLIPDFKMNMESGASFLSIGCGSGIDSVNFGEAFPNSTIIGVDHGALGIQKALCRKQGSDKNLTNVNFEIHDATKLPSDWSIGLIMPHPCIVSMIWGALIWKPGGYYLMIEFTAATNVNGNKGRILMEFLYGVSLLHCIPTALSQREDGVGLGACCGQETMRKMLKDAGFESVEVKPVEGFDYLVGILGKK